MGRVNLLILLMVVAFAWTVPVQAQSDHQQWYLEDYTPAHSSDLDENVFMAIFNNIAKDPVHTDADDDPLPLWIGYNIGHIPKEEFGPLRLMSQFDAYGGYVFKFRKHPLTPPGPLTFGETVALRLEDPFDHDDPDGEAFVRGWLYVSPTTRSVQLSFGPQYQWAFTGGPTGTIIKQLVTGTYPSRPHDIVGIYNSVLQDHLIYCEEDRVGLGWARDCGE